MTPSSNLISNDLMAEKAVRMAEKFDSIKEKQASNYHFLWLFY